MALSELLSEEASSTEDSHEGAEGVHDNNDFGIGTLVLAMALGTLSRMYITHMTGLPYTVILLVLGLVIGIILHESTVGDLSWLGDSLEKWVEVSPDVILFVFLPILIFESAFNTDVHIFQREFWQVLTLAGPGVVLATALTACVVKFTFPSDYGWGWDSCLMMGGMLSATDPVAVVALLKELGVSERLAVLIEGESLLNDATAIVVFNVFRDALVGAKDSSPLAVIETAARMSLGGPVIGMILGMLGSFSLGYIIDDALTEITLTVIVCFSAFMISEATELEVSGVLAVVTTGLVMSFYARGRISPGVEESMHTFWSTATYVANTVIFFISGLIIGDRALFDSHVEGRDWALLGLLYLALQIIRCLVVLVFLPVLTRGGYGMSHKQLSVLAFAGLRGAVVLTLGLIVVEDGRIEESQRSLILFYVAGIAAMTLCINGTLTGPLVHFLGLDRSTSAETEIYVRACSAIEARLEHKLDLLKGDRFLGDADWELVWRYIPVSTAKAYWHRIRHGNINLSVEEEEEIHVLSNGHPHAGGLKGTMEIRSRQVRKWFTRRVLRLSGGSNYRDLPFRLRQAWYTYHKDFNVANLAPSHAEAEQHRRDMELHRLNAEPRMMMEAEAWSNLNEEAETITQTPASSTLRKQLDNVGIMGIADAVGMMSNLGQAEMAQQAAGAAPGTLLAGANAASAPGTMSTAAGATLASAPGVAAGASSSGRGHGRPRSVGSVSGGGNDAGGSSNGGGGNAGGDNTNGKPNVGEQAEIDSEDLMPSGHAGASSSSTFADIGHWGGSKEEARLAIEGIKKLKEDRRRAAQAVAKSEARLARLQKDVGLLKHKGEEEEMAESIQMAKEVAAMKREKQEAPELTFKNHANPLYTRPGAISSGAHGRFHLRTGSLSPPILGDDGDLPPLRVEQAGAGAESKLSTRSGHTLRRPIPPAMAPLSTSTTSPVGNRRNRTIEEEPWVEGRGSSTDDDFADALTLDDDDGGIALDARGARLSSASTATTVPRGAGDKARGVQAETRTGRIGITAGAAAGSAAASGDVMTAAAAGAAAADAHSVLPSETPVVSEWDPYADDEEHEHDAAQEYDIVIGRGTLRSSDGEGDEGDSSEGEGQSRRRGPRRGRPGRASVIGPGAVTMGSMSEARVRFLTAVKAHCTERYRQGWLSSTGLRVLKENMDAQLDYEDTELQQWSHLSEAFTLPAPSMALIRKIPLIGSVLEPYVYRRLTFIFELASNFIAAHEDVDILELLNEGPVAYQLALEKNRQLQAAKATLSRQLPVFPELARSLKTQVAARYMLVQHRDVVREFFNHGHINEREFEGLIAQNNTARVRLDYHPHTDQIPDRVTLLKNVPFLRFLSDEDKEAVINDEKACQEQFYGSNVVLMQEKTSTLRGQKRSGWFNVVRGAVRQTTQGLVEHTSMGGTIRTRRLAKERLVNAGTVIGLDEQLLQAPYSCTYVTASFVHLFFFDKGQMMLLAEQYPGLKRGLWWLLAVSVVRHHHGFRRMDLSNVYQLMRTAEFQELKTRQPGSTTESRHRRGSLFNMMAPSSPIQAAVTLSRHKRRQQEDQREKDKGREREQEQEEERGQQPRRPLSLSPRRRAQPWADNSRHRLIRAAATSLTESRHKLAKGMLRTRSSTNFGGESSKEGDGAKAQEQAVRHRVVLEEGSQVLLLKGAMLPRDESHPLGHVKGREAVTRVRDVSGPVEFEDGSVLFIMPAVLIARSTSRHQLLMRDIEATYAAKVAAAEEVAAAAAAAAQTDSPRPTLSSTKWNSTGGSASGGQGLGAPAQPISPSRVNLGPPANPLIPMTETGELLHAGETSRRNAMATDAVTIAAADEAVPQAHPDTIRRKRTMRDAILAAKASSRWGLLAKVTPPKQSARSRGSTSGAETGVPDQERSSDGHTFARLAIGNSRHGDSFVDMMAVPVAHMDEDSPRSRAPSALLYPDSGDVVSAANADEIARRSERGRLRDEGERSESGPAWVGGRDFMSGGSVTTRAWGGGDEGTGGDGRSLPRTREAAVVAEVATGEDSRGGGRGGDGSVGVGVGVGVGGDGGGGGLSEAAEEKDHASFLRSADEGARIE